MAPPPKSLSLRIATPDPAHRWPPAAGAGAGPQTLDFHAGATPPGDLTMGDFNVALVIVATVVSMLVLLVNYQHPDDANQAYFAKLVVVLGVTVAVHAALSANSYSALAPLYDDLLLQAASLGAATDDWPYAVHLLA